ncbi:MAG: hypothetical protein M1819_001168 [Sarea resinae]|nr:MAG: hypothetical protein M1819_001168 [Sarea resinae]
MVSQPEPPERTLTVRRAPSVSSRASNSRRHRHSRSHQGGSSYQPQNEFPVFTHTGDVEILCSGFFDAGTSEEWARSQTQGQGPHDGLARIGGSEAAGREVGKVGASGRDGEKKMRWRYELDGGNKEGEVPMLVQKNPSTTLFGGSSTARPPPVRNKPPTPQAGFFRSMANFSAMHIPQNQPVDDPAEDTLRDYDNLFRIFYNYPPVLDSVNIANAYVECKGLLTLADMYDALDVVGPRVDHHLLQFQGRLWKQIAKYPPSYLKLGYLARSKVIFSEALVHVVGQWPAGANQLRNSLPDTVIDVIEDKVDELDEWKAKIEGRLFRLTLTTSKGERVTPFNSHLDWMAVSLFRQWLAESTTPPPAAPVTNVARGNDPRALPPAPPAFSPGRAYRLLGTGGSSYLGHDELKRFLKLRPDDYNRDSMKRFERRMDELKGMARELVKPLMRNFLELDLGKEGGGLGYLTCTRVEEHDFPWDE